MKGYYHKYFEGYKEDRVLNRNGRGTHIEYTYASYYFRQDMKDSMRVLLRILYVVMAAGTACAFLYASSRTVHCNQVIYMALCQAVTTLALLWFFWVLIYYIFAPREMTVYKYKSTAIQILKVCKWLAAALVLDAAAVIADMLVTGSFLQKEEMLCMASYLLAAGIAAGIGMIERSLPYERLSNDKEITWYREGMEWR